MIVVWPKESVVVMRLLVEAPTDPLAPFDPSTALDPLTPFDPIAELVPVDGLVEPNAPDDKVLDEPTEPKPALT